MTVDPFWDLAGPVLPVLTISHPEKAVRVADALLKGGVTRLEITLRTPCALDAITQVRGQIPSMTVGAGTVISPSNARDAVSAGAQFLVSPGTSPAVLKAMSTSGVPALPGAATPSEIVALLQAHHRYIKIYPTAALGGLSYLRALVEPLGEARLVPSGGITADNVESYLSLPQVAFVSGSWVAPSELIAAGDWNAIRQAALRAASLRS